MAAPRYRRAHQQLRAKLLALLIPGTPCPQPVNGIVCGQPMLPGQRLELGHDDFGGYIGLVHASCNHRAGAIKGNRLRRRRKTRPAKLTGRAW